MTVVAEDDAYKLEEEEHPVLFALAELKDLTEDLFFSKESA